MKSFAAAMVVLVGIVVGIVFYNVMLHDTVHDFEERITSIEACAAHNDWDGCQNSISGLLENWERVKPRLELFIHHNDIDEVNRLLYEIKGYCSFKNREDVLVKSGVLQVMIDRLWDNEQLVLKNIF